jgi:hypothetical protein
MQKFRGGAYCTKYVLKSDSRQVGTDKELPFQLISTKPPLVAGFVKYKDFVRFIGSSANL